jgi:protein-tyrosine phosphatase
MLTLSARNDKGSELVMRLLCPIKLDYYTALQFAMINKTVTKNTPSSNSIAINILYDFAICFEEKTMRKLSYVKFIAVLLCTLLLAGCGGSNSESQDLAAESRDLNASFSVERDKTDKVYMLHIEGNGHWQVFAGETADDIDTNTVVIEGDGANEINITDFSPNKRIYFQYILENSVKITASERLLPMEGAYNVRDMGGYKTAEGKTVKWGKAFRSGNLNLLSINDTLYLENIGIKTVVDFRTALEKTTAPDVWLNTIANRFEYPITTGSIMQSVMQMFQTAEDNMQVLVDANRHFVTDFQDEYKKFFEALTDEGKTPLLFHCSAGKDRAGFAAAMFLSALGVDRETIIEDYLLSAVYVEEKYASLASMFPHLTPAFTVYREYIEAAFETIDKEYGGVENYLREQLDVDLEFMRAIYTE